MWAGDGLIFLGGVGNDSFFTAENTGIVCFTPGTMILTPKGEVPVELLRRGDLVLTRDNGAKPLLWTPQRHLDQRALQSAPWLAPVELKAQRFGNDRNLIVSPQHGVLLHDKDRGGDEVLYRAVHLARLAGGGARTRAGCRSVTYIHLLFEQHEVIFSNGLASESLYPGPMALRGLDTMARQEVCALFPHLSSRSTAEVYGLSARRYSTSKMLPPHLCALGSITPQTRLTAHRQVAA